MEGKVCTLRLMFPNSTAEQTVEALKANNWDLDQTIDYMLAQTANEELVKKEQQQQQQHQQHNNVVLPPPPPPMINKNNNNNDGSDEEDRILREFLVLEQQRQASPTPVRLVQKTAVVEQVVAPTKVSVTTLLSEQEKSLEREKEREREREKEREREREREESNQRDISLLRTISNTLRELENEVRNLTSFASEPVVPESLPAPVVSEEQPVVVETVVVNPPNTNNVVVHPPNTNNVVVHPDSHEFDINNNNNNNNNENNKPILPEEVNLAIEQLELIFNSSLEKTEKILLQVKDEIASWKIKDNVKTFTVSVRNEISDILSSIAQFISPEQTEESMRKKEEKRKQLLDTLEKLQARNKQLEQERNAIIEENQRKKQLEKK